jgi:hypothetical protein
MKTYKNISVLVILSVIVIRGNSQPADFSGQLSLYTHYNGYNTYPWWSGGRFIPQLNYSFPSETDSRFDMEASANIYGNAGLRNFDSFSTNGNFKPYRLWARYSTSQFELRGGLQKINFGSATILRPLMWFDQIDPRDPLQLTDGVWGLLARYYFLNNTTVWLWTLYGNERPKGWEMIATNRKIPEAGGRVQVPAGTGEAALSYHFRVADSRSLNEQVIQFEKIPEHRIGFDARFDWTAGFWVEASWKKMNRDMGIFTNQEILNLGTDYTFNLGNGLSVIYEQLFAAFDEKPFEFRNTTVFSLLSASYTAGLFDNLSLIVYYDWRGQAAYNFINWQRKFNHSVLYIMGYLNPKDYRIPAQQAGEGLYGGAGIQIMFVFNH